LIISFKIKANNILKFITSLVWVVYSFFLALRRLKQVDLSELEASLDYRATGQSGIHNRDPVSKKGRKENNRTSTW
jgi:ribosomal protein S8